jgi:hypothetical protein
MDYIINKEVEIPNNLKIDSLRFVKLVGKVPQESEWQKRGKRFDDPALLSWLSNQNSPIPHNYGVIGGYGNIRMIDIDNPAMLSAFDIDTFTVRTPGGGYHKYIFSDYDNNHILISNGKTFGEFRAKNYQCVGANSNYYNEKKLDVTGV